MLSTWLNPRLNPASRGLLDMVIACFWFSIMNASVFLIQQRDNSLHFAEISLFRILINLLILLFTAIYLGQLRPLLGDGRPSLWLRGLFGATALMLAFAAIARIGPGETAFLGASNAVFVALLSPILIQQKNSLLAWIAIIGSFIGIALLLSPQPGNDLLGQSMALGSGLLGALAYLMIARTGNSNSPQTVIFYFCAVALLLHLLYFSFAEFNLPQRWDVLAILLLIGCSGSAAQQFMTRAYQSAPATLVSAVAYLGPVLTSVWDVMWFDRQATTNTIVGAIIMVLFGVLLPFIKNQAKD